MIFMGGPPPLGEEIAEILHRRIVPGLLRTSALQGLNPSAVMSSATQYHFGKEDIAAFASGLVDGDLDGAKIYLAQKIEDGFTASELVLGLLTDTARYLGDAWLDDTASFGDVGLGVSSLHCLLKTLDDELRHELFQIPEHRSILLSAMPGDTHVFGLSVLEVFFRNSGWATHSCFGNSETELLGKVSSIGFDAVGISVSCREDLSRCKSIIRKMRSNSQNGDMRIMVGGAPFVANRALADSLDVDGVCITAQEALETAAIICHLHPIQESEQEKADI